MNATHVFMAAPVFSAGLALSFLGMNRRALLKPIYLYWALFALGIFCFLLVQADLAGYSLGTISTVAAVIGVPSCGMSWLLSRALFRRDGAATLWPIGVVVALFVTSALLSLAQRLGVPADNAAMNMVMTVQTLTSSTVLLLALIEPMEGFRRNFPKGEKLFRLLFIAGYASLVTVAVIWEREAAANSEVALSMVRVTCAMIALAGATLAVFWRGAHPMPALQAGNAPSPRQVSDEDRALGVRITRMMAETPLHARADLKVSDLATALNVAEYKVTRSITGPLGFANFNRMVNSYRVDNAKRLLADPACADWSVLSIAMECGFGSIGPFNRAFKEATGQTPGAWRQARA